MDSAIKEFLEELPEDRRLAITQLRQTIINHLPEGFTETFSNNMIQFEVPLSLYPKGYHVTPNTPLPFIAIASQKQHIALYHMGMYMDDTLREWFVQAYQTAMPTKLDMGKSCIRFRNPKRVPYELVGQLSEKLTPEQYIGHYEQTHLLL